MKRGARGVRQTLPAGSVIGRIGGSGQPQVITSAQLSQMFMQNVVSSGGSSGGGLPSIGSGDVLGNATAGTAVASDTTLTALLDRAFGSTEGSILYRDATAWKALAPGTSGYVLTTQGTGAVPIWAAASGGGGGGGSGLFSPVFSTTPTTNNTGFTTWLNQPTGATVTNVATGIAVYCPGQNSANNVAAVKATPPTPPYTRKAFVICDVPSSGGNTSWVLGWSDGTKCLFAFVEYNNLVIYGTTTYANGSYTQFYSESLSIRDRWWVQISDDGTNLNISVCRDGASWRQIYSASRTAYLASPSYIIFGVDCYDTLMTATLMSWS